MKRFFHLLGFRLFLGVAVTVAAATTLFTMFLVDWQSGKYISAAQQSATNISDLISRSTRYSMLLNRREDVYEIIKTIGKEPRIERIRIIDKKGIVNFSTQESEVGKSVDMNAEACIGCHSTGKPVVPQNDPTLTRIFDSPKGYRVIGVITPIRNDAGCAASSCHAHSASQTVLGILDVMIPLQEVDQNIAQFEQTQIIGSLLLFAVLTGFVSIFIWRMVNIPVKKLAVGTQEIVKGNLDHRIDVQTNDEIGSLAISFNQMTQELKRARKELTAWTQTLEQRVSEKTEELRRAQKHMVQIEKMVSLGTLAATVAHELNNPLEGILTYAKLLRKKVGRGTPSAEDTQEMIGELTLIADETARCGNIVKNLLLFSREKVGEFKDSDLRFIIGQSLRLIDHHLKMNNIISEVKIDEHPVILYCDAHQLEEALLALEINAVEAMPAGGTFHIAVKELTYLNAVQIDITDTGTGIKEDEMPHIFEPFYTTKKDGKGTGLGLSVVYGIIERHSGSISVDSKPGIGTTFTITLPRQSAPQEPGASPH
ncbi:MAG: sensor histidine kinase [Ignavibacteriae bacterium]|nr:MAG: sensor histidine kinase [Ignavibacteriota bacterium]